MLRIAVCAAVLALAQGLATEAAAGLPSRVGQCVATMVKRVEARLVDGSSHQPIPDSGSAIGFADGGYQVSYDTVATIERSGDPVRPCLTSIPRGCPAGDARGREYKPTNLRTGASWTLPDAEHSCAGA